MNQNLNTESDEKNIRKLFDEMQASDAPNVPSFSAVLQRSSTSDSSVRIGRLVPIAAAIVILILAGVATNVYLKKPVPKDVVTQNNDKKKPIADKGPLPTAPKPSTQEITPRRIVYRPRKKAPLRIDLTISQWRSPTEFLLRTPGNELLKTVPRLNDSRVKINSAMPNDLN